MRKLDKLSLFFLILGLVGCATTDSDQRMSSQSVLDTILGTDPYSRVFDRHTKRDASHSEVESPFIADVTFWNEELRHAYVEEKKAHYRLSENEAEALIKEELAENEMYFVFIVSAMTRKSSWNTLEKPDGLWRLTLENEQGTTRVEPEDIRIVSRNDQKARYFYQRMSDFNRTYKVLFPREELAEAENIVLYITGPRGRLHFAFKNDITGSSEP